MKKLLGGLAVFAVIIALTLVFVTGRTPVRIGGMGAVGDQPFGDGTVMAVAGRAVFSPDGGRLAVVTGNALGVAEGGQVRSLTGADTNVVDAAWFANAATLLVAEGPAPTGTLVVVDIDGRVRGTITLAPSLGFGEGFGMAVDEGGRQAVVTAVDRPALGPPARHLATVDLTTGRTSPFTAPGGPDEEGPVLLGDGFVAYTSIDVDGTERALVAGPDGVTTADLGAGRAAGRAGSAVIVLGPDRVLRRFAPGRAVPVVLGRLPVGTVLTSIDAAGGQVVVREIALDGAGQRATRLRLVPVDRSPIAPDPPSEGYLGGP